MIRDMAVTTARFSGRTRKLLTVVNLHWAALGLLTLLNVWLALQLLFAWRSAGEHGAEALAQQQIALRSADLQARPLQGLDAKLATATEESDDFYTRRLPYERSQILTELGALAKRQGVKLTRVQYAESPRLEGTTAEVTEQRMDASLNGDYRPLVLFINSIERDRMFFVIRGVALSGQQSGSVGLRLSLTTFLRPARANETVHPLAAADSEIMQPAAAPPAGGQP